jgi:hypothetical protein
LRPLPATFIGASRVRPVRYRAKRQNFAAP